MYIPNIEKFRTPEHNRRIERCNKASGPVMLKPGIHVKQLRAYPDDMDAAIESFYATMQTQYPNFEVLSINTNMTFGAMLARVHTHQSRRRLCPSPYHKERDQASGRE